MAKSKGQVTLRGRFRPGAPVQLVRVRDESVLRSEGGEVVDEREVDADGAVTFDSGVEVGGRYFVVGRLDGELREVRVRGNAADDDHVLTQAPVSPDRVRLADGSWADEAPAREATPGREVAPGIGQHQVGGKVVQRSATARGSAHPVDTGSQEPLPRQEDLADDVVQMSATETGQATPVLAGPAAQADVPDGVFQRSATPEGVATPLHPGDAADAVRERESGMARATRGEPGKAAAEPLTAPTAPKPKRQRKPTPKRAAKAPARATAAKTPAAGKKAAAKTGGRSTSRRKK